MRIHNPEIRRTKEQYTRTGIPRPPCDQGSAHTLALIAIALSIILYLSVGLFSGLSSHTADSIQAAGDNNVSAQSIELRPGRPYANPTGLSAISDPEEIDAPALHERRQASSRNGRESHQAKLRRDPSNETAADQSTEGEAISTNTRFRPEQPAQLAKSHKTKQPDHRSHTTQQSASETPSPYTGPYGDFAITGQVLDEVGWPVPNIEVVASLLRLFDEHAGLNISGGVEVKRVLTDAAGGFRLQGLADGEYNVHTVANNFYPVETSVVSRTDVDGLKLVVVVEQRELLLSGQVESASGVPLSAVEIIPLSDPDKTVYSDQYGHYSLKIAVKRNSSYAIEFWADNHQEKILRLSNTETHGATELVRDVLLQPDNYLTTVSGTVTSNGTPVSGEQIYLKSALTNRKFGGTTDSGGKFAISNVEAGNEYILWLSPQGPYQLYRRNNLVVPPEGVNNLSINLAPEGIGRLFGQMVDLNGNPIPDFTLFLRSKESTRSHIPVTGNAEGYFAMDQVPKGELLLATSSLPKISISGIELPAGSEKKIDLILDVGSYQLQGRITDTSGNPIATANATLIWVYREQGVTYESIHKTTSTIDGGFEFSRLGPGERTLTIAAPGFETIRMPYDTTAQLGIPLEIRLEQKIGG